jgi:hypothetical protein
VARAASCAWSEAYDANARWVSPLTNSLPRGRTDAEKSASRNRIGRLKGYGNAIVPDVAAVFIRAFVEEFGEKFLPFQ